MNELPLWVLFLALALLLACSAFFSSSETSLMSLNRYRLRHLAKSGHKGALRASKLLKEPDRLIGLILLGNNFVNILATALATLIALRLYGEAGIAVATLFLTPVVLIFAEVAPKTLAALHPERVAFPATIILAPLQKILNPLVWLLNLVSNALLKPLGVNTADPGVESLSPEELRTVVMESGVMIPKRHRRMLLSILDLQDATVEDIMIPRSEVVGIDLDDDWSDIMTQIGSSQHTRLLVFRDGVDNALGFLHTRNVLAAMSVGESFTREHMMSILRPAYFIPEETALNTQLLNFQREKRRIGLVVDEYGDLLGLVTLEDILEEIVGEFTTDPSATGPAFLRQTDGSHLLHGSASIRSINRTLNWNLPTDGPKTLNGLVMETLENIPEPGASLILAGHPTEIVDIEDNRVLSVKVYPQVSRAE